MPNPDQRRFRYHNHTGDVNHHPVIGAPGHDVAPPFVVDTVDGERGARFPDRRPFRCATVERPCGNGQRFEVLRAHGGRREERQQHHGTESDTGDGARDVHFGAKIRENTASTVSALPATVGASSTCTHFAPGEPIDGLR